MIVIIIHTCHVVRNIDCMVVIVWTALILGIEILKDYVFDPSCILEVKLQSPEHILQGITIISTLLMSHPLITLTISIIVQEKHLAMVLEEMIGIGMSCPSISIVIDAHEPRT